MKSGCRRFMGLGVVSLLLFSGAPAVAEDQVAQAPAMKKLTLQFQGVDIVEILKLLAEQSGFNLVAGRNVSGRVTLFVKEVDSWEALEVVLAANELAYERHGQILTIMTQRDYELLHGQPYRDRRILKSIPLRYAKAADLSRALAQVKSTIGRVIADEATNTLILMDTPAVVEQMVKLVQEMDRPVESRIFKLNYGAVKAVAPVLQEAVTKGVGKVSMDERTNQVAVTDYPAKLEEIARMLEAFDEQTTEVLIDAKIVQVVLSEKFQLGIDWEVLVRENINLKGLNALKLGSGGALSIAQAAVSQVGDYSLLIEALKTFGDTRILSEPRLTVVNNQEAKILVGSKEPYVTRSVSQTGTGTAVTSESVTFLDVGVKLFVTPTITGDGFVQMKVRPEVSTKTGALITSDKNEIPIVETAEAETVLLVEDGGTVILGGLIKDEISLDRVGTPFLSDLPLLGALFRAEKRSTKKSELIVFLTPHIVLGGRSGSVEPPAAAGGEAAALSPEEYDGQVRRAVERIVQVQTMLREVRGTVSVEFMVAPDGRLQGRPEAVAPGDGAAGRWAEQAVLAASPFPPFSSKMQAAPRRFSLSLRYE